MAGKGSAESKLLSHGILFDDGRRLEIDDDGRGIIVREKERRLKKELIVVVEQQPHKKQPHTTLLKEKLVYLFTYYLTP